VVNYQISLLQSNCKKFTEAILILINILQIRTQCAAFRQGMADVINLEWLRMFDHHELQVIISGAVIPVDISDLQHHTNYSGKFF